MRNEWEARGSEDKETEETAMKWNGRRKETTRHRSEKWEGKR